ncbi:MAG TPA: metalloregulator ArsR/SmtB family transcription factor [Terriglobales bacterium]|nr:metalloregulator ArsR/SmtB family transcription factor [Terriglobales bacterium]
MTLTTIKTKAALTPGKLSVVFKALSDPSRLQILTMLNQTGCCTVATNAKDKGMCACDIEAKLDLSQPTISHHMRILREAGLVHGEKVGQWMWYRRNEALLQEVGRALSTTI